MTTESTRSKLGAIGKLFAAGTGVVVVTLAVGTNVFDRDMSEAEWPIALYTAAACAVGALVAYWVGDLGQPRWHMAHPGGLHLEGWRIAKYLVKRTDLRRLHRPTDRRVLVVVKGSDVGVAKVIRPGNDYGVKHLRVEADAYSDLEERVNPDDYKRYFCKMNVDRSRDDSLSFIITERAVGIPLRRFKFSPRAESELFNLAYSTARALELLHSVERPHGDFVPDNIICGPDGRARVIDLGYADKLAGGQHAAHGLGHVTTSDTRSTPALKYVRPSTRDNRFIAPSDEVFAWASVMFEFMARRPPLAAVRDLTTSDDGLVTADLQFVPPWLHHTMRCAWAAPEANPIQNSAELTKSLRSARNDLYLDYKAPTAAAPDTAQRFPFRGRRRLALYGVPMLITGAAVIGTVLAQPEVDSEAVEPEDGRPANRTTIAVGPPEAEFLDGPGEVLGWLRTHDAAQALLSDREPFRAHVRSLAATDDGGCIGATPIGVGDVALTGCDDASRVTFWPDPATDRFLLSMTGDDRLYCLSPHTPVPDERKWSIGFADCSSTEANFDVAWNAGGLRLSSDIGGDRFFMGVLNGAVVPGAGVYLYSFDYGTEQERFVVTDAESFEL